MEYKFAVLGTGGVGKSAMTIQLIQNHFVDEYDPTIEDSYRKQVEIDGETCLIDVLDTGGREEFSAMRNQYINTSQGFLIVYSITSRSSFEEAVRHRDQVASMKEDIFQVPIVLVGNKADLSDTDREVTTLEGEELAKAWKVPFLESSAKTRTNIDEAFFGVVRAIRKSSNSNKNLNQKKKKKGILRTIQAWFVH